MRAVFVLGLVTCLFVCVFAVDPRARSVVRLEDQIRELEQDIDNFVALHGNERQLEAKRMRLNSLRSFHDRQREALEAAGLSLDDLDREAIRQELQDMIPARSLFGGQGMDVQPPHLPVFGDIPRPNFDIPRPNFDAGHQSFDAEALRREHTERMERLRREHSELINSRNMQPGAPSIPVPGDVTSHDESIFRSVLQKLGYERSRQILSEYAPSDD